MGYYDVDPPDPGRQEHSSPHRLALTCRECSFKTNDAAPASIAQAMTHLDQHPSHVMLYRGVPQVWTRGGRR